MTQTSIQESYMRCVDCDETFDFWKYANIADTDHAGHKVVAVTLEEFVACLNSCEEDGCFAENFFDSKTDTMQQDLKFLKNLIDNATWHAAKKVTA